MQRQIHSDSPPQSQTPSGLCGRTSRALGAPCWPPISRWRLTLYVLAVTVTGCGGDEHVATSGATCCAAGFASMAPNLAACRNDLDCVAGSACMDEAPGASNVPDTTCSGGVQTHNACQIPETRSGNRQALTSGFQVGAFRLTQVKGDSNEILPAFTWQDNERLRIVHCALFACRPVVGARDTPEHLEVLNFDRCVLAAEVFEPGSGVFDLTNPSIEHTPDKRETSCDLRPRRISELSVGCWAYDDTDIVAATPMESVSAGGIFNYQIAFDLGCSTRESTKVCIDEIGQLGACLLGTCRQLCVDAADCAPPDIVGESLDPLSTDGGVEGGSPPTPPSSPSMVCDRSDHYVGVCRDSKEVP